MSAGNMTPANRPVSTPRNQWTNRAFAEDGRANNRGFLFLPASRFHKRGRKSPSRTKTGQKHRRLRATNKSKHKAKPDPFRMTLYYLRNAATEVHGPVPPPKSIEQTRKN